MPELNFPDYIVKRLLQGKTQSVFILSDRKEKMSKSLMRLYDMVIKEKISLGNDHCKQVIPIYMSLSKESGDVINEYFIVEYMWRTAIGLEKEDLTMNHVADNVKNIFDRENSKYHFLILLDGVDEKTVVKKTISEIRRLSEKENVTVCVTANAEMGKTLDLDDFICLDNKSFR